MQTLRHLTRAIVEHFPPAPTFDPNDIPDLTGRVIIITGANTGLGKETARVLLQRNAKVYLAGRTQDKYKATIRRLEDETGHEGHFLALDLADLHSVKRAAEEFKSKEQDLHVLINNAGVMNCPIHWTTDQEYDMQLGTNVLGHFYFTKLLLPNLLATAKKDPSGHARLIHLSSSAAYFADGLDFNTFKDGPARVRKGTRRLYRQSKLANAILSNEFARRYGDQGLVSMAVNPGNLDTELSRYASSFHRWFLKMFWLHPSYRGALTILWAATSEDAVKANGKFLIPWARVGEQPAPEDEKLGKELWSWLEEQVAKI